MGFYEQLPYTNFSNLNLSELIKVVKELAVKFDEFKALNTITYEGAWNITKNYKAWAVVSDENGNGYISLQPVPAGIEITNTTYWLRLYDFLSEIGVLAQRVTNLESTVGNHTTQIGNLQNAINNQGNRITSLENWTANRTRSSFADRNILFVGDSYTNGGNVTKKWYETMCETINPGHYYVSTEGGEGFSAGAGKHYLDRINDFISAHTTAVCQSITDLFITGGYNDITATISDIQSSSSNPYNMEKCVQLCRSKFPNATIYIAYFARTPLVKGNGRHNIIFIERTATAYREGARWLNCKYVTGSEIMLHDYRLFDTDHVHPNQLGHNYLGHYMAQWFMNGSWSYNTDTDNNIRPLLLTHNASDCVEGHMTKISPAFGVNNVYEQLTDEGVILKVINVTGSVTDGNNAFDCAPSTGTAANTFNLGYFNDPSYRAYFSLLGSNNSFKVNATALIKDNNGDFHNLPCIITVSSNNEILLNFQEMSGNSFLHINGLHDISYLSGFEVVLPLHSC